MQDWEPQINRVKSRLFWFTKWDKNSGTLNTFIQCLGNQKMPIVYKNSKDKDKFKLANYEYTISPPHHKTELAQEQVFIACL